MGLLLPQREQQEQGESQAGRCDDGDDADPGAAPDAEPDRSPAHAGQVVLRSRCPLQPPPEHGPQHVVVTHLALLPGDRGAFPAPEPDGPWPCPRRSPWPTPPLSTGSRPRTGAPPLPAGAGAAIAPLATGPWPGPGRRRVPPAPSRSENAASTAAPR